MFYGRKEELELLNDLSRKRTASLVCILGRRRIGKSTLIKQFSKKFDSYFEVQGLAPYPKMKSQVQLDHFAKQLKLHFGGPLNVFRDWEEALEELANKTKKGRHLILLDEISWLAWRDPLFPALLKDIWDRRFKNNNQLILVLCGSVSSWIQKNILNHANFVGRVSAQINLRELSLNELNNFFKNFSGKIGTIEKLKVLSITGGVPKYLEEAIINGHLDYHMAQLCFSENGFLANEYEKIFNDIFGVKKKSLEKIVRSCVDRHWEPHLLAKKLKTPQNSDFKENLDILELSGFIERDFYLKLNGKLTSLSRIRLSDNYLRFYLKYIEPMAKVLKSSRKNIKSLNQLDGFEIVQGFQFENLILNNRHLVHKILHLEDSQIIASGPHRQIKKSNNKGNCQVDLLVHAKGNSFYVCEIKCRKYINKSVIDEVEKKMKALSFPRRSSVRPVLIYSGDIYLPDQEEIQQYFSHIISLEQLMEEK